ncbi:hypothetical protein ACFFRE_02075 [Aciditerrimonas ferrireducens]|uniref:Nucleotidyltransferase n=1 Tax=Aciditerrimonas ferrireducens TaxID=667306 RepID=A0ABV6BZU0_9ACTN
MTPETDLARIVEVLDRHGVEYLIVGGHATRAYGATRPTKDADCLVKTEKENLRRLAAALKELHARLRVSGLSDEESAALPIQIDAILEQQEAFSNWRTDAGDLDVMRSMPGPDGRPRRYEDLAGDARVLPYAGIHIRVASLHAIVASKEQANRPKDQEALPELHELQQRLAQRRSSRPSQPPPPQPRPTPRQGPTPSP